MLRKLLFNPIFRRHVELSTVRLSSNSNGAEHQNTEKIISLNDYQEASESELEDLSDKLESVLEERYDRGADVSLNNGVLTAVVDTENTYVINKQTPNRQIWLSSPMSGPMRFDFISGRWVEKYTQVELRQLLSKELSQILKNQVEF